METEHLASFGAGLFAGVCGIMLGHPLDTLKVRLQTGQSLPCGIGKAELFRQLYRGIIPPVVTAGFVQSLLFSSYELAKSYAKRSLDYDHLQAVFYGGIVSGSSISCITTPIGVVKIQQQVRSNKGMLNCFKDIVRTHGWTALYRAFSLMIVMEAYGRGVYLWSYEGSKMLLNENKFIRKHLRKEGSDDSSMYERMISASIAGMLSWFVIYPLDVIKSKVQVDLDRIQYKSISDCVKRTWREFGFSGFFRGVSFTLIRAAPVAATILPIYEATRNSLHDFFEDHYFV